MISSFLYISLVTALLHVDVRLNGKPVPQYPVNVYVFSSGRPVGQKKFQTNAQGRIQTNVPSDENSNVIVRVDYEGVTYYSDILSPDDLRKPVRIDVYKTTGDAKVLKGRELRTFVTLLSENLRFDQELIVENLSSMTFVGNKEGGSETEVVRISFPAKTYNLQLHDGFVQDEFRFDGHDLVITKPVTPGTTRWSWSFAIEIDGGSLPLDQGFSVPLSTLSFSTSPESLNISGLPLKNIGKKYFGGRWLPVFEANLQGKKNLKILIGGIPRKFLVEPLVPWIVLLILSLGLIYFGRKEAKSSTLTCDEKNSLLNALRSLERAREEGIVTPKEFYERRMKMIAELYPYYQNKVR